MDRLDLFPTEMWISELNHIDNEIVVSCTYHQEHIVTWKLADDVVSDVLSNFLRNSAQQMLKVAIQEEV